MIDLELPAVSIMAAVKYPYVLEFASCLRGYNAYGAAWTAEITSCILNVLSGMEQKRWLFIMGQLLIIPETG